MMTISSGIVSHVTYSHPISIYLIRIVDFRTIITGIAFLIMIKILLILISNISTIIGVVRYIIVIYINEETSEKRNDAVGPTLIAEASQIM
jgi:hypothetical protein